MKSIIILYLLGAAPLILTSCSSNLVDREHQAFQSRPDYRQTREIYRNDNLVHSANSENTKVKIDLSDQRAQMLVNGKVAIDFPCCTGKARKRTPTGDFTITKKKRYKRSTIFGSIYRKGHRVYKGDRRKYRRRRYDRYVGSALPYWMRLTNGGIGMHYSAYVHRYPGSNGCIRMPKEPVKIIFAKTQVGTPVQIVQ